MPVQQIRWDGEQVLQIQGGKKVAISTVLTNIKSNLILTNLSIKFKYSREKFKLEQ